MLNDTVGRLFPTLCANPELAAVLARCEARLQLMQRERPRGDDETTRTLVPVRR